MDQVDQIIEKLQAMLREGDLKPGKRIPSERVLAEQFSTTRGYVRKALQKLEFYGVLEIQPQKGVYVSSIRSIALDALMTNVLNFDAFNMSDLIETRSNLEVFAARLAAERGDESDIQKIKEAHERFVQAYELDKPTLEEDHLFHLAIVRASKNTVLQSLLTLITPEIIAMNKDYIEDPKFHSKKSLSEHEEILKGLLNKDPISTGQAMENHMEQSKYRRLGERTDMVQ